MNRDALVVGINCYPFLKNSPTDDSQKLETAARDAEDIAQKLEDCGYFRVRRLPETLIEGRLKVDPKNGVTAMELERAIAQLFCPRTQNPPDTALLYFAGHGLRKEIGITEGYLATSDSSPRKGMWGVSLNWLGQLLQANQARQQIVWLDCCHSGELFNYLQIANTQKLYFYISASRDFESAYSNINSPHGALTEILLQGLDPSKYLDEVVSHLTLARFVEQKLTGTPQQPIIQHCNQEILLTCTPENKHRLYLTTPREAISSPPIPSTHLACNADQKANHNFPQSDKDKLYDALLRLDYVKQESLFQDFVQTNQIGACLIHGNPEYGQRWLLHRLLKAIPTNNTASIQKEFSFLRKVQRGSLDALWQDIRNKLKLKCQPLPGEIAKAVWNLWQTQTVVLIFEDADQVTETYLEQFLHEFWQPLVNFASGRSPKFCNYRLLVFLIDFDGCADRWSISLAEELDTAWKPHIPLKLPPIRPLKDLELAYWLEKAFSDLPGKLTASIESTVQIILENSDNGLQEPAMAYICEQCGQDWDEINRTRYV